MTVLHLEESHQSIPSVSCSIITLEDVLEALIQEQIYDEMDVAGRRPNTPNILDMMEPLEEGEEKSYQLV